MINVKNLRKEIYQEGPTRESKFYIGIGRESFNKPNSATIYRFSRGIITKYNLENYTHIQLAYNEPSQVIFFKFIKVKEGQKIPVWYFKITRDRMILKISALRFARKYQINNDVNVGRYSVHEGSIGDSYVELAIALPEKNQTE